MEINYFARGFLFGLFLGWLYLTPRRPPPDKNTKILGIPDTKDIEAIKEKLRRAG